jgi:hypothetical protein
MNIFLAEGYRRIAGWRRSIGKKRGFSLEIAPPGDRDITA